MNLDTFFEKFDLFADAPNAVAKMRELVLELAVQGKIVEQRPAEGGGHALLRLIQKENPPSKIEHEPESVDAELPSIPSSWALSKLGEVAEIIRGVSFPGSAKSKTPSDGDVACLRTASVQAEIDWDDLIYISPSHVSREDQWVAQNDIMISMANSYALVGKVAIVRKVPLKATFGAFLAAIRPILIEPYFLLYVLRSPRMQAAFRASSSQTTNIANISLGRMRPLPFPLPPLAEQKRIVEKVDELMALCDQLEAQQKERETKKSVLARASLARFAVAPNPANLNFILHKSYDIPPADLRKAILTLAVQGTLVPQEPNDEPAEDLAKRIKGERLRLITEGKVGKSADFAPVAESDRPYDLPESWAWVPLGNITFIRTGKLDANANSPGGQYPFFTCAKDPLRIDRYAYDGECVLLAGNGNFDVNYYDGKFEAYQRTYIIEGVSRDMVDGRYLFRFIQKYADTLREMSVGGVISYIKIGFLNDAPFPLPPLAEQRRIVAKVDQLMALVDALESQLVASRAAGEKLLAALVAELTAGKEPHAAA